MSVRSMYSRRCSSVPHSSSVGTSMCVPCTLPRCGTPARSNSWRITVRHHVGLRARAAVGRRHRAMQVAGRDRAPAPRDRLLAFSEPRLVSVQRPALGAEPAHLGAELLVLLSELEIHSPTLELGEALAVQ